MKLDQVAHLNVRSNACQGVGLHVVLGLDIEAIFTCEDTTLHVVVGLVYQHNRDDNSGAHSRGNAGYLSRSWAEALVFELVGLAT